MDIVNYLPIALLLYNTSFLSCSVNALIWFPVAPFLGLVFNVDSFQEWTINQPVFKSITTSVFTSLPYQGLIVNLCIFWVLFQCNYVFINFRNIKIVTLKLHLEIWYLWDLCQDLVFFTHSRAHVQLWNIFVKISRVIWLVWL